MARPLTFLITVIAVACAALFLLLPMTKMTHHGERIEPAPGQTAAPAPQTRPAPAPAAVRPQVDRPAADTVASPAPGNPAGEVSIAVNGHVGNALGTSLAGIEIELVSKGLAGEDIVRERITSDQFGNFTLRLAPKRRYQLTIAARGDYAGYRLEAFTGSDTDPLRDIILERVEMVDVDGMIVDANRAPVPDFELRLRHMTLDYPDRIIRSDSSGYFSLRRYPAGESRIASKQSSNFRIQGLELRPGEYHNLTLMLDRGNHYLSGWVRDVNGLPMTLVTVTAKSDIDTGDYHSYSYRSTTTDESGAFEFSELSGQRLTLGFSSPGFRTHFHKHEFSSFADTIEIRLDHE